MQKDWGRELYLHSLMHLCVSSIIDQQDLTKKNNLSAIRRITWFLYVHDLRRLHLRFYRFRLSRRHYRVERMRINRKKKQKSTVDLSSSPNRIINDNVPCVIYPYSPPLLPPLYPPDILINLKTAEIRRKLQESFHVGGQLFCFGPFFLPSLSLYYSLLSLSIF